jgi:pyruvate, water dikinase
MTGGILMSKRLIYRLEELGIGHNDLVGKKCANLGEMTKAGLRVPVGFALTVDAYDYFMNTTGAIDEMRQRLAGFSPGRNDVKEFEKLTSSFREIVENKEMPDVIANDVISHYEKICQKVQHLDMPVAIRSAGAVSRPGQYETFLNVRGKDDVLKHIIKVWSSTFNTRSLMWRASEGLPLEYDPIGVAVLQMVKASKAGVMLTINPITADRTKVVINANWGLGESVVSGETNPDYYMVDRISLEILERNIAKKTHQFCAADDSSGAEYVEVPSEKQDMACLNDDEIVQLVRMGIVVEDYFGSPQDIEWVIDEGIQFPDNIFLVQARPEKTFETYKPKPIYDDSESLMRLMVDKLIRG